MALIAVFSLGFKHSLELSDEQIKARLNVIPEVKAYQAKAAEYHLQPEELLERQGSGVYMTYIAVNQHQFDDGDPTTLRDLTKAKELRLYVTLDRVRGHNIESLCVQNYPNDLQMRFFKSTVEDIKNTECLELSDPSEDSTLDDVTRPWVGIRHYPDPAPKSY